MTVGKQREGNMNLNVILLNTDEVVPAALLDTVRSLPNINEAMVLELPELVGA
jgi:hypothetical protein